MLGQLNRRLTQSSSSHRDSWGPLLITQVPLCASQSEFLSSLQEAMEVLSPEQGPNLYTRMSLQTMINYTPESEMKLLAILFDKSISVEEFRSRVGEVVKDVILREELTSAAAQIYLSGKETMEAKDVFVYEAIAAGVSTTSALKLMKKALKKTSTIVCWDGAILDETSYISSLQQVLAMAEKYHRVVRFVRWSHEIPMVSFRELLKRNITQFLRTGHYWDTQLVHHSYCYAKFLMSLTTNTSIPPAVRSAGSEKVDNINVELSEIPSSQRMTQGLLAAHYLYHMNAQGFVSVLNAGNAQPAVQQQSEQQLEAPPSEHQSQVSAVSDATNQPVPVKRRSLRSLLASTQSFLQPLASNANNVSNIDPVSISTAPAIDSSAQSKDSIRNFSNNASSYPWAAWLDENNVIHRLRGMSSSTDDQDQWRSIYGLAVSHPNTTGSMEANDSDDKLRLQTVQSNSNMYGRDDYNDVEHKQDDNATQSQWNMYLSSPSEQETFPSARIHFESEGTSVVGTGSANSVAGSGSMKNLGTSSHEESPFPFLVDRDSKEDKTLHQYLDSPGNSTETNYSETIGYRTAAVFPAHPPAHSHNSAAENLAAIDELLLYQQQNEEWLDTDTEVNPMVAVVTPSSTSELDNTAQQKSSSTYLSPSRPSSKHPTSIAPHKSVAHSKARSAQAPQDSIEKPLLQLKNPDMSSANGATVPADQQHASSFRQIFCCGY